MNEEILVVEDDDIFRKRLKKAFEARGYTAHEAADLPSASQIITEKKPTRAVVDLALEEGSGLELLSEYKREVPNGKFVILTGYGTVSTTVSALKAGATNYLTKPANADEILAAFDEGEQDSTAPADGMPLPTLSQVEWENIQKVLNDCNGNITHASKKLGLHRRSLQRKLSKIPEPLT